MYNCNVMLTKTTLNSPVNLRSSSRGYQLCLVTQYSNKHYLAAHSLPDHFFFILPQTNILFMLSSRPCTDWITDVRCCSLSFVRARYKYLCGKKTTNEERYWKCLCGVSKSWAYAATGVGAVRKWCCIRQIIIDIVFSAINLQLLTFREKKSDNDNTVININTWLCKCIEVR